MPTTFVGFLFINNREFCGQTFHSYFCSYPSATCNFEVAVTLETFIAGCLHDGLELSKRIEIVTKGLLQKQTSAQFLIFANNFVDGLLRADALVVVVYFLAIGIHPAGDDVQVIVVGVIVRIDKKRLPLIIIVHFVKILVSNIQKLLLRIFMSPAGDGHMELSLADMLVSCRIINQVLLQLFGSVAISGSHITEVLHFKEYCLAFGNFSLVVLDGMEICAGG